MNPEDAIRIFYCSKKLFARIKKVKEAHAKSAKDFLIAARSKQAEPTPVLPDGIQGEGLYRVKFGSVSRKAYHDGGGGILFYSEYETGGKVELKTMPGLRAELGLKKEAPLSEILAEARKQIPALVNVDVSVGAASGVSVAQKGPEVAEIVDRIENVGIRNVLINTIRDVEEVEARQDEFSIGRAAEINAAVQARQEMLEALAEFHSNAVSSAVEAGMGEGLVRQSKKFFLEGEETLIKALQAMPDAESGRILRTTPSNKILKVSKMFNLQKDIIETSNQFLRYLDKECSQSVRLKVERWKGEQTEPREGPRASRAV